MAVTAPAPKDVPDAGFHALLGARESAENEDKGDSGFFHLRQSWRGALGTL